LPDPLPDPLLERRQRFGGTAITAGIGDASGLTAGAKGAAEAENIGQQMAYAAAQSAVSQGVNIAVGLQDKFSWQAMAASAIAAPVMNKIDKFFGTTDNQRQFNNIQAAQTSQYGFGGTLATEFLKSTTRQASTILVNRQGRMEWSSIAVDTFGNAIGNSLGNSIAKDIRDSRQNVAATQSSSVQDRLANFPDLHIVNDQAYDANGNPVDLPLALGENNAGTRTDAPAWAGSHIRHVGRVGYSDNGEVNITDKPLPRDANFEQGAAFQADVERRIAENPFGLTFDSVDSGSLVENADGQSPFRNIPVIGSMMNVGDAVSTYVSPFINQANPPDLLRASGNAAMGLIEGTANLFFNYGAQPGAPDYIPFLQDHRFAYDKPYFGGNAETLIDVGAMVAGVRAGGPREVANSAVSWNPLTGAGPLGPKVASTFRSGSYIELVTSETTTLYRAYGGTAKEIGPYWTRTPPAGPLQSTIDSALNPAWGNTASKVVRIDVPAGARIFEGAAAPQGGLVGGGNQVFIPRVDPAWIIK